MVGKPRCLPPPGQHNRKVNKIARNKMVNGGFLPASCYDGSYFRKENNGLFKQQFGKLHKIRKKSIKRHSCRQLVLSSKKKPVLSKKDIFFLYCAICHDLI